MRKEDLFENINEIDEKYIKVADTYNPKKKSNAWMKWVATAACLCLVVVGSVTLLSNNGEDRGVGNPVPGGNMMDLGEEKQDIESEQIAETDNDTDIDVSIDQPVQNETEISKSYDDIWGGSYLDESGMWIVWLTENTVENQQKVFEKNPDLREDKVTFKEADFSLVYLNELLAIISDGMSDGKLPFVSTAMVSEQTNRVEVYMTTNDEKSVNTVLSFDANGAITIKYSDDEGVEDLGTLKYSDDEGVEDIGIIE